MYLPEMARLTVVSWTPDDVRHLGHVHGLELGGALIEEPLLPGDDLFGNALDGLLPLLDGADEEFAAADFFADVTAHLLAAAGIGHQVLVEVADAQAGELLVVERDVIDAIGAFHVHIGGDILLGSGGEGGGGPGIEGGDVFGGPRDFADRDREFPGDLGKTFPGEIVQVGGDDAAFEAVLPALASELDEQAVAQVFRADAGRIEGLNDAGGGFQASEGDALGRLRSPSGAWRKPRSSRLPISISASCAHLLGAVGHAELLDQVVLQGHRET